MISSIRTDQLAFSMRQKIGSFFSVYRAAISKNALIFHVWVLHDKFRGVTFYHEADNLIIMYVKFNFLQSLTVQPWAVILPGEAQSLCQSCEQTNNYYNWTHFFLTLQ